MKSTLGLFIVGFAVTLFASLAQPVQASEVTIRPFLIDETLKPREDVENIVAITNDYEFRKAVLYATVNEISIDSSGAIKEFVTPVMTDRTVTVTSWVEVSRGRIEVDPGGSTEVPIRLKIHPFAEPGEYHVFVGFVQAPNRPAAEAIAMAGDAKGVIVKVTVADEREDSMRIVGFIIDRFVTGDDKRVIDIEVENLGDIPSAPVGEIIFYDSRGIEVTTVPVNTAGDIVAPGERMVLKSIIPLDDGLGRFKANVQLKYGENQKASIYDTTFFYMMPIHLLLLIFGGVLLVVLFVALLFRRAFVTHDDEDECDEVTMYVRDGHGAEPKDHDINLKNN